MSNVKRPCSNYFSLEADEAIRELLRDAMQRHVTGKPLPKFYALHTEYEERLFKIIDNAIDEHCDSCDEKCSDDDRRGEPIPWEDLG